MARQGIGRSAIAALVALGVAWLPTAAAATPAWTTYRHDALRSGIDPDSTSPVAPAQAWQTPALDGEIYGEPLVYGSEVFVATENDTVYALDAATGAVVWKTSVGTAVSAGQLPCGDIKPTVGITSTPVIDPSTNEIFVVADTWDGSNPATIQHQLFGLNVADGSVVAGLPVGIDPPGSIHADQLQRSALALDGDEIVVGYGGNDGDCGTYHGWLVAAPESGVGVQSVFEVDPAGKGGAIWGSGNGPIVDRAGDIWTSTGNGSAQAYGGQESVVKLSPSLAELDHWAPSNWQTLDLRDKDLGSSSPILLPGNLAFEMGKSGVGYLLSSTGLGGTGAKPVFSASLCQSFGGGIYVGGVIYVSCTNGTHALALNTTKRTFHALAGWRVTAGAVGPPIFAGGLVWSAGWGRGILDGLAPTTGAVKFSASLGRFDHFASPGAGGGRLFVANGNEVTAFTIATLG